MESLSLGILPFYFIDSCKSIEADSYLKMFWS